MTAREQAKKRRWLRMRIWMTAVAFGLACLTLAGQAVNLQLFQHRELSARAQRQFLRQVDLAPRRGVIYDRRQEELAVSLDTESVYASPVKIKSPRITGRRLARALGLNPRKLIRRLKGERGFVWAARRVSPDQARAVRRLDLEGVGLLKEPRRFYPYSALACHVLGFAGLDARGLEGLELRYDKMLRGRSARITSLRDALGRRRRVTPVSRTSLPEGRHLMLTLDKGVQYQVEKILAETVARHKAKAGQAVVMIPQTGGILAMASVPAFDPNVYQRYPRDAYRNRVITDAFEPGSTFKMFVAAAALQSGRIPLERLFDCENGKWKLDDRVIHDTHPHQKLNLADIIKLSSNIGAAKVGMALGAKDLYRGFKSFGFGQPTGVDLPGEARGILRPGARWKPVDLANICFGQGVAVTALQLTAAAAAIANGGVMMRPHLVRAVMDGPAHLEREIQPEAVRRVMGVREARILTSMLTRVTEPGGTGTRAHIPGIPVAGKTGTAQKVKPGGGYSRTDYISSFVGFAPADDPQVAVLVVIDTPRKGHYGGVTAAPAFARITRIALDALGVHRPPPPLRMAAARPSPAAAAVRGQGSEAKAAQELAAGRTPDLRGLTLRQVLRLGGPKRLKIRARGWGRVVSQKPPPGRRLGETLAVRLKPRTGEAS